MSSLSEYDEITSYKTIGEQVEAFANKDSVEWEFSKDKDFRYVSVSGKCSYEGIDNQNFELIFKIDFDGYALISTEVESLSLNGKKLADTEFNSLLYKILIETNEDKLSQNNASESSMWESELKKA